MPRHLTRLIKTLTPCAVILTVFAGLCPPEAGATDLQPRMPAGVRYVFTDEDFLPEVYVDNINVLAAGSYRTHFVIYDPLSVVVYEDSVDGTDLQPFTTDTVRASLSWGPGVTGLYCLSVRVAFQQDIDNSNNTLFHDVDVLLGRTTARWIVEDRIPLIFPDTANTWAFMGWTPLLPGDTLSSFDETEFKIGIDRPTWFAWMDYGKNTFFAHPGAFGLIDATDSAFTWSRTSWWPLVNRRFPAGFRPDSLNDLIYGTPPPETLIANPTTLTDSTTTVTGDSVCALFVSGAVLYPNDTRFETDLDILQGNLQKERLGPRVTNVVRLTNPTRQQLEDQLDSMVGKYRKVYYNWIGHGSRFYTVTGDSNKPENFTYANLFRRLSAIGADSVIVNIGACYSGSALSSFRAFKNEFNFKHLVVITSSNRDTVSWSYPIRTGTGDYVIPGAFTWFFALCYGDPAAETDGIAGITEVEAFHWTRKQNPVLPGLGGTMNDIMDPQILVYEAKEAKMASTRFDNADLSVERTSGFGPNLRYEVLMSLSTPNTDSTDTNTVYVSPGRYWSISADTLEADMRFNIGVRYRLGTDSIISFSDLGLVHRKNSTGRWNVHPKISVDTSRKTILAIDVAGFSDWALAVVKPGSAVDVEESPGDRPLAFGLFQNYPNPFNPATTIEFSVPRAGPVSLVLYDLLGRQVRAVLEEDLGAGTHRVRLEAGGLASGMYIYRLYAGGSVAQKKLMLLK